MFILKEFHTCDAFSATGVAKLMYRMFNTKTGNGERGTGNGERGAGSGERRAGSGEGKSGNELSAETSTKIQNGGPKNEREKEEDKGSNSCLG